jgi:hypothetical protein
MPGLHHVLTAARVKVIDGQAVFGCNIGHAEFGILKFGNIIIEIYKAISF